MKRWLLGFHEGDNKRDERGNQIMTIYIKIKGGEEIREFLQKLADTFRILDDETLNNIDKSTDEFRRYYEFPIIFSLRKEESVWSIYWLTVVSIEYYGLLKWSKEAVNLKEGLKIIDKEWKQWHAGIKMDQALQTMDKELSK